MVMIITTKSENKIDLSPFILEDKDLMDMKLSDILELRTQMKKIDMDEIPEDKVKVVKLIQENFKNLMVKAVDHIENYLELCKRAQNLVVVELSHLVPKGIILASTTAYPGLNIKYGAIKNIQRHDLIYAWMYAKVLKHREIDTTLASIIKKNPDKEILYGELEILDKGAALMALQKAFRKVADVIAGNGKPDFYNEEFCFLKDEASDHPRAIFVSLAKRNRKSPNLHQVQKMLGDRRDIYFDPNSEFRYEENVKVNVYIGSMSGEPTTMNVKVPYFLRAYDLVKVEDKKKKG